MKLKKKPKRILIGILVVVAVAAIAYVAINTFGGKEVKEAKVLKTIKKYGYTLKDNKTKRYQEMFAELDKILKKDPVDEEEYAKQITKMFIYDFYSQEDKSAKTDVGGTDLGIVWEIRPGKYGIFLGDTYGRAFKPYQAKPNTAESHWRCNVLAFSNDTVLDDGLSINAMCTDGRGYAREIIYGGKDKSGKGDWTSIPTAAIRANGMDYVHYFNMKNWNGWVTNYSGMYKSTDEGQTWTKCEHVHFSSDSSFGQIGYFKKGRYV